MHADHRVIVFIVVIRVVYMNMLGNQLLKNERLPDKTDILNSWNECLEMKRRRLVAEVERLTLNQQKVIKFLAHHPVMEPTRQNVLSEVNLSGGSVRLCMQFLLKKDFVIKVTFEDDLLPLLKKDQYRVLDPLLAFSLRKYQ